MVIDRYDRGRARWTQRRGGAASNASRPPSPASGRSGIWRPRDGRGLEVLRRGRLDAESPVHVSTLDSEASGSRVHPFRPLSGPIIAGVGCIGRGFGSRPGSAQRDQQRIARANHTARADRRRITILIYTEWRNRQIEQLDRDYEDYRRENQSRFETEFGSWRERRVGQRKAVESVTEHMQVVGSDDSPVGTVDCTRGDRIILAKKDPQADGHHHSIPCAWVETVDDKVSEPHRRGRDPAWRDESEAGPCSKRMTRLEARTTEPELRGLSQLTRKLIARREA